MGPEGNQWHYDCKTAIYDLSRRPRGSSSGAAKVLTVRTTAGAAGRRVSVAPARTTLVVIDTQNFFLHPRCRDHPSGLATVAPTKQLIRDCRAAGIEVGEKRKRNRW